MWTASMAQEEDAQVFPFTPTHHLRDGFLSFAEFLLRNAGEWSKPHPPWPTPPPPVSFSGSDRFVKGRLPHRTLAISASLSSLLDDAATPLLDVYNHGVVGADHFHTLVSIQDTTCDDTLSIMHDTKHGDDHRVSTASTHCGTSIHVVSPDNVPKVDRNCVLSQAEEAVQGLSSNAMVACSTDDSLEGNAGCIHVVSPDNVPKVDRKCVCSQPEEAVRGLSSNVMVACSTADVLEDNADCVPSHDASANGSTEVPTCNTDNLLLTDSQRKQGKVQHLHEDDGRLQPLYDTGLPRTQPDGDDCSKKLDGSIYVPGNASMVNKSCPHMQYEEGCLPLTVGSLETLVEGSNVAIETLGDVVVGCSQLSEFQGSLPPSIKASDGDVVAKVSLLSPTKSYNENNLADDTVGVAEISVPSKSHNDPPILCQDEQIDGGLEEGELSFPDDKCLDTMEDGKTAGEAQMQQSHPLDATQLEPKALESTTDDDEMNQPISLFVSRYRTRSSVNSSTRKSSPPDTNRDSKMEKKTGNKRKIGEQEHGMDMADKGISRQAKGTQKESSWY